MRKTRHVTTGIFSYGKCLAMHAVL